MGRWSILPRARSRNNVMNRCRDVQCEQRGRLMVVSDEPKKKRACGIVLPCIWAGTCSTLGHRWMPMAGRVQFGNAEPRFYTAWVKSGPDGPEIQRPLCPKADSKSDIAGGPEVKVIFDHLVGGGQPPAQAWLRRASLIRPANYAFSSPGNPEQLLQLLHRAVRRRQHRPAGCRGDLRRRRRHAVLRQCNQVAIAQIA